MATDIDRDDLKRMIDATANAVVAKVLGQDASMRAWIAERGTSWVVYWWENDHQRQRSCGDGKAGRSLAEKLRRQIDAELTLGKRPLTSSVRWEQFVSQYDERILSGVSVGYRRLALRCLKNFARIVQPGQVANVTTADLDRFAAERRREQHRHTSTPLRPGTVNNDLRITRSALRVAHEWGYLAVVPRVRLEREPQRLPRYVTSDDFDRLYAMCDLATLPVVDGIDRAAWWRALLTTLYLTGWRIGETMALRRSEVDLDAGLARLLAETTKGKREELIPLHPVVVEHLRRLPGFWERQFHWPHTHRTLHTQFVRLQTLCGLGVSGKTASARYGFHDFRRAFGTMNAAAMPPRTLQHLMRHRSGQTTARYYQNPMATVANAVQHLHVPTSARTTG